jgi:hypothetical protein
VKNLQERQEALQRSLKAYHEFGRNKVSLLTALQATHQFIRAGHPGGGGGEADSPSNCAMQVGRTWLSACCCAYFATVLLIRIRIILVRWIDPHYFGPLDPHPDPQYFGPLDGSALFWSPGSASGSVSNNNIQIYKLDPEPHQFFYRCLAEMYGM